MSQNVTVGEKGHPSVIPGLPTGMDMEGTTSKKSRAASGDTETEDMPALHGKLEKTLCQNTDSYLNQ